MKGKNVDNITPCVGILLFQQDKVLLVRHEEGAGHLTGVYGVPGGRLNGVETEKEAAVRELKEETGLETSIDSSEEYSENVYIADIDRKGGIKQKFSMKIFVCTGFSGELIASDETTPQWIPVIEIYNYKLLPNVEQMIKDGKEFFQADGATN